MLEAGRGPGQGMSLEFEITDCHGILTKGHVNRIRDNRLTWNPYEGARQHNLR